MNFLRILFVLSLATNYIFAMEKPKLQNPSFRMHSEAEVDSRLNNIGEQYFNSKAQLGKKLGGKDLAYFQTMMAIDNALHDFDAYLTLGSLGAQMQTMIKPNREAIFAALLNGFPDALKAHEAMNALAKSAEAKAKADEKKAKDKKGKGEKK